MTRYPIYIPSRGRADKALTAQLLDRESLPFYLVVEPQEADEYRAVWGDRVLVMDRSDQGIYYARNWCKDHAMSTGAERHWQLDDNIRAFKWFSAGDRVKAAAPKALLSVERLVDRFTNVGIAGLMHTAFGRDIKEPFSVNQQPYSAVLVRSDEYRWRPEVVEDTDYALQVLSGGECTIVVRAWQIEKPPSGGMPGGNTDRHYQEDGRLERSRALKRAWPGLGIKVKWNKERGRWAVTTGHLWRRFPQQPIVRERVD